MRTYGRVSDGADGLKWVRVDPDPNGFTDPIWITTLIQCLKLSPGESPFYANHGIPAQQSVITQIFPDFYVAQTQSQFAGYFASLQISKLASREPTYKVNLLTQQGAKITETIAV